MKYYEYEIIGAAPEQKKVSLGWWALFAFVMGGTTAWALHTAFKK